MEQPLPELMYSPASISGIYLQNSLPSVQTNEFNLHDALLKYNISLDRINNDPTYRIPLYKAFSLLEHSFSAFQNPASALETVFDLRIKSFPILGYAVMASKTLEDAILRLARYEPLVWGAGNIQLEKDNMQCHLRWFPLVETPYQAVEVALTGWFSIGTQLLENPNQNSNKTPTLKPNAIHFSHSCHGSIADYEKLFGCPVKFSQTYNEIGFSSDLLNAPLIDQDENLVTMMDEQANQLLNNYKTSVNLENEVRAFLMRSSKMSVDSLPSQEESAKYFNLPNRQFRTLIEQKNLNYRTMIDEFRKDLSAYYLFQTDTPLNTVSSLCGFSEQSSFNRAIKRWYNTTPKRLRSI